MKKYLQFFFVALFVATTFAFTACSDDDQPNVLAGTTWKIMTSEEDADMVGATIKFNSNGTFDSPFGWSYAKWYHNNNVLKLVVGEGNADDFMIGKLEINGQHATYKYRWEDVDGEWVDEDVYTITLQKQ